MNWQRALFHVWGNPHLQACWCRYERRPVLLANPPLIIHGPTVCIQSNRSIVEKFTAEAQRALGNPMRCAHEETRRKTRSRKRIRISFVFFFVFLHGRNSFLSAPSAPPR